MSLAAKFVCISFIILIPSLIGWLGTIDHWQPERTSCRIFRYGMWLAAIMFVLSASAFVLQIAGPE